MLVNIEQQKKVMKNFCWKVSENIIFSNLNMTDFFLSNFLSILNHFQVIEKKLKMVSYH